MIQNKSSPFNWAGTYQQPVGPAQILPLKHNKINRGSECSGCDYKHMCRHCRGRHQGFYCWKEHSSRFNSFLPTQSNQQYLKLGNARQSNKPYPFQPKSRHPSLITIVRAILRSKYLIELMALQTVFVYISLVFRLLTRVIILSIQ